MAIEHAGQFQVKQREQGSGNFLVSRPYRAQTVYRKALPGARRWYAGYVLWITGCEIPSKEASLSQRCEAKLIHKETSCWQPQSDNRSYASIHGPVDWNSHGRDSYFLFFMRISSWSRHRDSKGIVEGAPDNWWGKLWLGLYVLILMMQSSDLSHL